MFATIENMIAIISALIISLIPVVLNTFGYSFFKRPLILNSLLALAAGTLLGDVWFHVLPETLEYFDVEQVLTLTLSGILAFFIFESLIHTYLHRKENTDWGLAGVNLAADGLHNFVDGILIAASFSISIEAGIAATIAIALHELPQEIGDIAILAKAGLSKFKINLWNFAIGLIAILGVIFGLFIDSLSENTGLLSTFAAGGFLYIALSNLLPEIKHQHSFRKLSLQLLCLALGLVVMFLLKQVLE